jgi:hypothetical protein
MWVAFEAVTEIASENRMRKFFLIGAAVVLGIVSLITDLIRDIPEPDPFEHEIEALIEELVSPNRPANPEREWTLGGLPSHYNTAAQEPVERALQDLMKIEDKRIIPLLIKHRSDARYCRSVLTSILSDQTVGQTCMEVLDSLVDRCGRRSYYKGCPDYGSSAIGLDPEGWWATHSHLSLDEMRFKALEWTLNAEEGELERGRWDIHLKNLNLTPDQWRERYIIPLERELAARLNYRPAGQ